MTIPPYTWKDISLLDDENTVYPGEREDEIAENVSQLNVSTTELQKTIKTLGKAIDEQSRESNRQFRIATTISIIALLVSLFAAILPAILRS